MKKHLCVVLICILCILITGCGISKSELKENRELFEAKLKEVCEDYGLKYTKIEIGEFNKIEGIYVTNAYIYADNYKKLGSINAFRFAKRIDNLDAEIKTKNSEIISYATAIIDNSNNDKYTYEYNKNFEYLMKGSESVYTIKNGETIYDIFSKGY